MVISNNGDGYHHQCYHQPQSVPRGFCARCQAQHVIDPLAADFKQLCEAFLMVGMEAAAQLQRVRGLAEGTWFVESSSLKPAPPSQGLGLLLQMSHVTSLLLPFLSLHNGLTQICLKDRLFMIQFLKIN